MHSGRRPHMESALKRRPYGLGFRVPYMASDRVALRGEQFE